MNKNIRDSGRKKEILTIDRIDSLSLLLWAFVTVGLLLFIGFTFVGLMKPEDNEYNWFFYLDAFILAVVIMLQLIKRYRRYTEQFTLTRFRMRGR